jgi:hypothetical protein
MESVKITKNKIATKTILVLISALTLSSFASTIPVQAVTSYTYILNGPFFYDGSIPPSNTTVGGAMLWINGTVQRFTLNATNGDTTDTINFTSILPAYQILWNASTTLNYTSVIDLQQLTTTQNLTIYIPSPSTPAYVYTFLPTDFAGMTNPFLRASITTDGAHYNILQQANLTSNSAPTFVLAQYGTYELSFICDEGTYTQTFTAQNIFSITLPVFSGFFQNQNTTSPNTLIERINSSMIGITYYDPSNTTEWVYIFVTHRSGSITVNDYSTNNTGNSQIILWNDADADKSYNVNVTALIGSTEYIWMLIAPTTPSTNPFLGIFDFLGPTVSTMPHVTSGWPFELDSAAIAQLAGSAIIMLFLTIGSFRSAGACCILSWIIAGVLMYMGWWGNSTVTYSTVPMFVFAGFIGFFIHLGEAKQTERDT